jgi:hypothetical protein
MGRGNRADSEERGFRLLAFKASKARTRPSSFYGQTCAALPVASVGDQKKFDSSIFPLRSSTPASPIRTSEAQEGQCIALLPTESQS